jgi:hypothetical protein
MALRPVKSSRLMAASLLFLMLATSWVPTSAQSNDPIVLSFSTVGDSPQDPTKPDPTTRPLPGQEQCSNQRISQPSNCRGEVSHQLIINPHSVDECSDGYPELSFTVSRTDFERQHSLKQQTTWRLR